MPGKNFNKYHNKKIIVGGVKFDSQKEYNRYAELSMMQKAGLISDLQRQVRFEIIPKTATEREAFYVADYVYTKADGKKIVEDCKSEMTKKLHDYILKRKLMKWRYPDYIFIES